MTAIGHGNVRRVTVDRAIELAVGTGVAVLVVIGFVTSYETLRGLAVTDGGFAPWLAPAVPLSFDLGIVVLSLKIVAAARQGRHALVHRALVAGLSVATVAVNGTASNGTAGQLLHAIPPAMFVICFEGLIADARREAMASQPPRTGRWKAAALSPLGSFRTWRHYVLRSVALVPPADGNSQPSPGRTGAQPGSPARKTPGPAPTVQPKADDRLAIAREALQREPGLTAAVLAQALHEQGHDVSVRTAQRLKARVLAPAHWVG